MSTTRPTSPKDPPLNSSNATPTKSEPREAEEAPNFWRTVDAADGSGRKVTFYDLDAAEGHVVRKWRDERKIKQKKRNPE